MVAAILYVLAALAFVLAAIGTNINRVPNLIGLGLALLTIAELITHVHIES